MKKIKINPRKELISLLRGFFSLPILISLNRAGIIKDILKKDLNIKRYKGIKNKNFLKSILLYLQNLNLIKEKKNNQFYATALGKKILKRIGSFHLLNSYGPFINNIEKLLKLNSTNSISCNRKENVIGSGLTNGRKFFPKSFEFFDKNDFNFVIDVGCGNGEYLSRCIKFFSKANFIASDVSLKALKECKKNLKNKFPNKKVSYFQCNAYNVNKLCSFINRLNVHQKKTLITFWYVVHEISKKDKKRIINFFNQIYKKCPYAEILVGEIVKIEPNLLSANKDISIMPEFLFFHEISGQGVLSINELDYIKRRIPYRLAKSFNFDYVKNGKKKTPSALIWFLKPNKKNFFKIIQN